MTREQVKDIADRSWTHDWPQPTDQIEGRIEGRDGVWLITPEVAISLIEARAGATVHNFIGHGATFLGADWTKKEAVDFFIESRGIKIALIFPPNVTMGHHLIAINETRRWAFDVGAIAESRMFAV